MDLEDYWVKQRLEARGLEWNRENYIQARWRGELPTDADGEPFVPEDELPEEFQGG